MTKRLFAAVLVLFVFCLLTGCSKTHSVSQKQNSYSVTDMTGRNLTFTEAPQRVIAMNPSDITNLIALGSLDLLVGRGEYCNTPAVIKALPMVGTGPNTNIEEIIALKPDLVIMNIMNQSEAHSEALEKAGIQVLTLKTDSLDDVAQAIELLGKCLGRETEGKAAVSAYWTKLQTVKDNCANAPESKVYYELSPLEEGLWAAGRGTFLNQIGKLMNLSNIFDTANTTGWVQVSEEQIISQNPDIIITLAPDSANKQTVISEIKNRKGWDKINAVKNNKVYCVSADKLSQPGAALADGAEELSRELFGTGE